MTYNVNIIAGCHCPTLRQIDKALDMIDAKNKYPSRRLEAKDIRNGFVNIDPDGNYPIDYYCVMPVFFTGVRGILREGEFYGRAAGQANEIARVFPDGVVKIHFLVEPTLTHLNRHFNDLPPGVQNHLQNGVVGAPSWVPPLLAVRDEILNGSVTVWNLKTTQKWRSTLLMTLYGDFIDEVYVKGIGYQSFSAKHFPYDDALDEKQFELDLDVIDSLAELNLIE